MTRFWDYRRHDDGLQVLEHPGAEPYRYLVWLPGYDHAFARIDAELDLPQTDIGRLIRMIQANEGRLSNNKRKLFTRLPDGVVECIENIVRQAFSE